MVNWWFGLAIWIPGIPGHERDCYLGNPKPPTQTTHLPLSP